MFFIAILISIDFESAMALTWKNVSVTHFQNYIIFANFKTYQFHLDHFLS